MSDPRSADLDLARWRCVSYCRCAPSDRDGHFEKSGDGVWVKYEDVRGVLAFINGYLLEHRQMLKDNGAHDTIVKAVLHLETEIEKL